MSGSTFDPSSFLRGLNLADARVQRGAKRGIALCLAQGEKRAKELVPIESGTLAATISGDAASITVSADKIEGRLTAGGGEASDYALRQHEEELTHDHPVSGVYASKYIETPIKELAAEAPQVIADEIRAELSSAGGGK